MCECDLFDAGNGIMIPVCKKCGRPTGGTTDVSVVELEGIGKAYKFNVSCYHCHLDQFYYVDLDLEKRFVVSPTIKETLIKEDD